ncbi:MAG TPA: polysaccharide deacetylase family protein [Phycisphaerae bacterium]|nr:polysaccharide deacetylase family protein [Phycisphaerae bacterium]HRY71314.1 polysaccharide deacetylase family protein [Phycisphaerae bacterium]HSA29702.1 polysaccharide deacetylase family protein [Phycisphaerae bacterium]
MKKTKPRTTSPGFADHAFDVVFGFDMETDIGSFTPFYEGVKRGTPRLLELLDKHGVRATFFWTGHAAESNPDMVHRVRDAGHETGCHGLYHETLGDPIFPLPNNWPILPSEVEGRLREATRIVREVSGVRPTSFRCPRLWGSTKVLNVLEKLGYLADASFPLYFYQKPFVPYHPSAKDWTRPGRMRIVEIPNFCDLSMESNDPYQRDRDQWPVFRTESAEFLMQKADRFIEYVQTRGKRPVVCFYLHPWEFHPMPQGALDFGESSVRPLPFIVKNCGPKALKQLDRVCTLFKERGGRFVTAKELAAEYS